MPADKKSAILTSEVIQPDWQLPDNVRAFCTTRVGGVSKGEYCSNNLALHVDDAESDVLENRLRLSEKFAMPSQPIWLNQVHSTMVADASTDMPNDEIEADASYTNQKGIVLSVMTADCLPILLCDKSGTQVAAVHAGWRGLLDGIIENAVNRFSVKGPDVVAWLGPAIGPLAFEVGADVRDGFVEKDLDAIQAFRLCSEHKWLANIYQLARQRLNNMGIESIFGGDFCTFTDEERFYSYRRDKVCGRMASLIWLDK